MRPMRLENDLGGSLRGAEPRESRGSADSEVEACRRELQSSVSQRSSPPAPKMRESACRADKEGDPRASSDFASTLLRLLAGRATRRSRHGRTVQPCTPAFSNSSSSLLPLTLTSTLVHRPRSSSTTTTPCAQPKDENYDTLLAKLQTQIAARQARLQQIRLRERRANALLITYGLACWILYAVLWYFGIVGGRHGPWPVAAAGGAPVVLGPIACVPLLAASREFPELTRDAQHHLHPESIALVLPPQGGQGG